ncbi:FlgT C-terminal domain-containing protein [Aeromicrobium sp. HA]|uniref:FlgT C-terminal domain-containing protein n=1 Tax=Aeromicrobium sp. HA TaxID=3009077 RepID=UPI003FA493D0
MTDRLTGKVVRLITDDELLINLGSAAGVAVGDTFKVLDSRTMNVREPGTNRDLGSLERVKSRLQVVQVSEHMALAEVMGRSTGISGATRILTGGSISSRLTSGTWPEGVEPGDPVVSVPRPKSRSTN